MNRDVRFYGEKFVKEFGKLSAISHYVRREIIISDNKRIVNFKFRNI